MNQQSDSEFDDTLRDYFSSQLDSQLGSCQKRFEREINARVSAEPRRLWRRLGWVSVTGLAAAVLILSFGLLSLFTGQQNHSSQHPQLSNNMTNSATPATQPEDEPVVTYHQTITYRTVDQGTVVLDGEIPARQICRQVIDHVEWIDPDRNIPIEVDIPSQEIVYVAMTTY